MNDRSQLQCPLCGRDNSCGRAGGKRVCWCFSQVIPQAVLDRVPPELHACICPSCAAGASAADPDDYVASPCIGLCRLDPDRSTCQGCLRTTAEIAGWAGMSSAERRAVLNRLRA